MMWAEHANAFEDLVFQSGWRGLLLPHKNIPDVLIWRHSALLSTDSGDDTDDASSKGHFWRIFLFYRIKISQSTEALRVFCALKTHFDFFALPVPSRAPLIFSFSLFRASSRSLFNDPDLFAAIGFLFAVSSSSVASALYDECVFERFFSVHFSEWDSGWRCAGGGGEAQ